MYTIKANNYLRFETYFQEPYMTLHMEWSFGTEKDELEQLGDQLEAGPNAELGTFGIF